jgi:hypothetical protein
MFAIRSLRSVRSLSAALFAAAAIVSFNLPARAEDIGATAARAAQVKRATTSLGTAQPPSATTLNSPQSHPFANGFLYFPGAQTGLNIGGRLNVGKSHLYVPYYGTISNDPAHPGVQGTAGVAYGFRTWDISVLNGGFGSPPAPAIPGADAPKVNPALSLSIRF